MMGSIISRFRRQPSAKEKLEKLEKSIKSLEQYHFSTQQRQKYLIGSLLLYSIVLYILAVLLFYFLYFPKERNNQVIYTIPLLIFPILIYLVKKFLHWFFRRKITGNDIKLTELRNEKKQILEKVMETETYKVAKDLLDKFDSEKQNKSSSSTEKLKQTAEEMELRKRTDSARGVPVNQVRASPVNGASVLSAVPTPRGYVSTGRTPVLARPILPKDRGVADRLVEYLIGDGPNNRYALICRRCNSHNGMAVKEEFEFIAFRCCYCHYPNPARKQRPNAPKLPDSPQVSPRHLRKPSSEPTTDEARSEEETEEEVMSDPEDKKIESSGNSGDTPKNSAEQPKNTEDDTESVQTESQKEG